METFGKKFIDFSKNFPRFRIQRNKTYIEKKAV